MRWKAILGFSVALIVAGLLIIYFFVPFNTTELEFGSAPKNYNFSLGNATKIVQFYPNMRYLSPEISYKIYEACSLQKKSDMVWALDIIDNLTILDFYAVDYGEEISVTCTDENRFNGEMFVGGEGGVTNVTVSGNFNVIYNGKVLLIRDSDCPNPNIAIHELLHALGFDHSENPNNIMYEISNCKQTIGEDMPKFLNEIYSVPSQPDLLFENASAVMNGQYLDANLTVRNNGLKYSGESKIIISADSKKVKELELPALDVGYGSNLFLTNIWIGKINVKEIEFLIYNNFEELDKENNRIVLEIKR